MSRSNLPASVLVWLGRQGTRALIVAILLGIAIPPLAARLKPFFPETVFVMLCLTFLRIEPRALGVEFRRPLVLAISAAWIVLAIPLGFGLGIRVLGLDASMPGLTFALLLQVISPPLMSAPALAALLGFRAALSLAAMMVGTLLAPFTAPVLAQAILGTVLGMSPVHLGLKLFVFLGGSALTAAAIRHLAGAAWAARQRERIDGLNVIALSVFAIAVMDGMAARIVAEPWLVAGVAAITFASVLTVMAVTGLLFAALGRPQAFELALTAGYRNMALMVAAMGANVPDFTWTYFAVAQFPIYLLPHALKLAARRTGLPAPRAADEKAS